MSVEWTFFIFVTVGTLVLILAPDPWRVAMLESAFGRWFDRRFTKLGYALANAYESAIVAPVRWIERKVTRG